MKHVVLALITAGALFYGGCYSVPALDGNTRSSEDFGALSWVAMGEDGRCYLVRERAKIVEAAREVQCPAWLRQ